MTSSGMPAIGDEAFTPFKNAVVSITRDLSTTWKHDHMNEAAVRQVIVLRLLSEAGFNIFDPLEVVPEVSDSAGRRVDLEVRLKGKPCFVLEHKRLGHSLSDRKIVHAVSYAFTKGIRWAIATNGRNWHVFDTDRTGGAAIDPRLSLKLPETNAGGFAQNLYRVLNRRVWEHDRLEGVLVNTFKV
jgi:predicted type IV restriction endonuclease